MVALALRTSPLIYFIFLSFILLLLFVWGNCLASKRPCCPLASGHMSKIQVDINSVQQIRFPERLPEGFTSPSPPPALTCASQTKLLRAKLMGFGVCVEVKRVGESEDK